MKKLLFVMLAAFIFVSCSKDESDLSPNDGQYIARSGDMVVCMQLIKVVVALTLRPT